MSIFGSIVSAHVVEAQLLDVLREWTHAYLGEAERQNSVAVNSTARPKSYRRTSGEAVDVDDRLLPRVVLRSSGWSNPISDGESNSLAFAMTVAGFWKGRKSEETLDRIRLAEAAVAVLLQQKATDAPLVNDIVLTDGDYGVIDADRENTLAAFEIEFTVQVAAARQILGGPTSADPEPTQPPEDPTEYEDRPTVGDGDYHPQITTTPVSPGEELPE